MEGSISRRRMLTDLGTTAGAAWLGGLSNVPWAAWAEASPTEAPVLISGVTRPDIVPYAEAHLPSRRWRSDSALEKALSQISGSGLHLRRDPFCATPCRVPRPHPGHHPPRTAIEVLGSTRTGSAPTG
jgi:hypothetical protein